MAVLRPHLALTVTDVERAIPFYSALFGTTPEKVRPGYAKFSVADPALNFTLNEGESMGFDSMIPHVLRNVGDGEFEGIWFVHGSRH